MGPSDLELMELIRQLYGLDRATWWASALAVLVEATRARGAFVGVDRDGVQERGRIGEVPEIMNDFPTRPSVRFVEEGARIRVRPEVFPHDVLWSLHGCCDDPRRHVRLSSLATHLRLACDFAIGRGEGAPLPGRLGGADRRRRVAAAQALARMSERAASCALLAARGYTNGQIAEYLDLTSATVGRALQEAYRFFGITGRAELDVATLLALPKPAAAERTP